MKVLVTGGSGFLGVWIVRRLLAKGIAVRIFDMNSNRDLMREIVGSQADDLEWHIGDISNSHDVSSAAEGCTAAIHLAGVLVPFCHANPVRGAEINLIGTLNVFTAGLRNGFQNIVYTSSAGVFGPGEGRFPKPITHYGAFKLATEGSARAYWHDHGLPSVGFRPFIVYGPGRESGLTAAVSCACRAAAFGEAYTITYTGSAGYVYVDDVAAAVEAALFSPVRDAPVFNLAGVVASISDIVTEICHQVPGAVIAAKGDILPFACELADDGLYDVFPALPRTTLADGLAATIAHYRP
jgi:nucleoside-diphosphate-sugar epimerase